jgi:hypothetical protein
MWKLIIKFTHARMTVFVVSSTIGFTKATSYPREGNLHGKRHSLQLSKSDNL